MQRGQKRAKTKTKPSKKIENQVKNPYLSFLYTLEWKEVCALALFVVCGGKGLKTKKKKISTFSAASAPPGVLSIKLDKEPVERKIISKFQTILPF